MATTVSSPWGKPGAWALDAEEHEAELQSQQNSVVSASSAAAEFPSLAAAAATKQPKKKKQTLSLAEFSNYSSAAAPAKPSYQESKSLTYDEQLNLPTGPRQRSAEELDRNRLGGGFRSYGLNSNSRYGDDSSTNSRFSRSNSRDSIREAASSRADETDDWSKGKRSSFGNGFERRERTGGGGSFFDSQSKADEADSWISSKPSKPVVFEKRGSFDSLSRDRERNVASDNWGRRKEESEGMGAAASMRPKLVLQPRTLPVAEGNGAPAKPKGGSPFGDARPREEVLKEKGKDWKEIDEKLEAMKIVKEAERGGERGDPERKGFWNGKGNERVEGSWRKTYVADSGSEHHSDGKNENGHTEEDELASDNGHAEGN